MNNYEMIDLFMNDAKCSIDAHNAVSIYELYIEQIIKKLCIESNYCYIPSDLSLYDERLELHTISSCENSRIDKRITEEVLESNQLFFQPILGCTERGKILIVDGVHRLLAMRKKLSQESLLVLLDEDLLNSKYIDLIVPSTIIDHSDDIMALTKNKNANILIIEKIKKYDMQFCRIKIKGYGIIIRMIIYWSKYIDRVYDLRTNDDISLEPASIINNKIDIKKME